MASRSDRWALASLAMSALLSALGTSVANVGLPALETAFGASFHAVQWIVLAYLLAITTLIVGVGRLGDIVGRRRLLVAGIALFTAASFACGLSPALGVLVAARAVQGTGAAIMMTLAIAMIGDAIPTTNTGTAMGLLGTMSAVGTALGPSLGGVLLAIFSWRALFFLTVPLGLATLVVARRHLPPDTAPVVRGVGSFDSVGTLLLALTLGAYALAMTTANGQFGARTLALLTVATIGAVAFVIVEGRVPSPLVRIAAFRDRALFASLSANALVATVLMATLVVGPFYLARALGLDAARTGLVLSAGPLVAAVAGVPAGRAADRFGTRASSLLGLVGLLAGTMLLATLPTTLGVAGYVGPMVLLTGGYALFQAANNAAVMAGVRASERGAIAGLLSLSRNLGLVTGASVMGAVFSLGVRLVARDASAATAAALGMRSTFAVGSLLLIVATAMVARLRVVRVGSPVD